MRIERSCRLAFTLIELILVLALLAMVTSLAAPSLSRFFRARALDSDGFPMLMWVDSQRRVYGLQEEGTTQNSNTQDADPKAEEFAFGDDVQVEAVNASPISVNGQNVPAIRFLPDGEADENSPTTLRLTGRNGDTLWLIQTTNRLSYEIRSSDR
jgi:prepilin-type N-terminal cleavage/methylation domain-containing protein